MPLAPAGEVELSYERAGSGPPLLAIMGMSGSRLSWGEPFLGSLRESFEVIAYDHRGVGESSRMEGPFTIADLARDATGLLDALELDSAHVFGISMGGMVAQELALAHPERIRTLALGCTYCGGPGSTLAPRPSPSGWSSRCAAATPPSPCGRAGRSASRPAFAMTPSSTTPTSPARLRDPSPGR
jgi:3-oxoadipate enol-lactonase